MHPRIYIELARINQGWWTLAEAARALDIDIGKLRAWFRGDDIPDYAAALRIAAAGGVPHELALRDAAAWYATPRTRRRPTRRFAASVPQARDMIAKLRAAAWRIRRNHLARRVLEALVLFLALGA